jgi:N,N'-diacetyllegionaminate synthase
MRPNTLSLGARQIGAGSPCFVLAGVAAAHGGSPETALRMLDASFKMGADGIVFQVFRADLLAVRRHPGRKDLERLEIPAKEWRRVLAAARGSGLAVVIEAFDSPSLELAAECGADGVQIHTTDMENPTLIRTAAGLARPILFATGGVPPEAVRDALDLAGGVPAGLLHGLETFPTAVEEIRFRDLGDWKERYRVPVGFLDHTDGGSAFALVAPALAAAHGADLVEKHFTLDRREKGFDYQSSVSPEDFYRMVELLRQAERASGDGLPAATEGAVRYHRDVARSIVAGGLIPRGEVLTAGMLAFKRTDPRFDAGFSPRESDRVIGRRAARPIQADETIREDMLE